MKKINFGIILIILTLIGLVVYIVNEEKTKSIDKIEALEFIKEYFNVYNEYSMLEKEDRNIEKQIDTQKYNAYLSKMNGDLSKFLLDSRQEAILKQYKDRLDLQVKGKYMYYDYNKEIVEVKSYTFNEEYISIYLKIKMTVDKDKRESPTLVKETNRYIGEIKKQKGEDYTDEIICLKRISKGNYKITYHSIMDYEVFSFESHKGGNRWEFL